MITDPTLRDGDGCFRPGQSGNPGGGGRFLPGQSGNPGGATKGYVKLGTRLQRRLREEPETAEAIVADLIAAARAGDLAAIKILLDRHDGPLALKIEGMSEAEMTARLVALGEALKRRLPPEQHQLIAEAMVEVMGSNGEDRERLVESDP